MAGLLELSNDHGNLSNDLRIAISELISPMYSAWISMNNETVVLPAAAPAHVSPITLENDVQRLLPHRFRPAVVWLFLLPIHKNEYPARQIRVRLSGAANPEAISQRWTSQTRKLWQRVS